MTLCEKINNLIRTLKLQFEERIKIYVDNDVQAGSEMSKKKRRQKSDM